MVDVSVIIPCRTGEFRVSRAVESIYDEQINMEIIVGIDGSDRELKEQLKSLDIKGLIVHEYNKPIGTTKILNNLLHMSKGEFVARMDADDISLPLRLKEQSDFLRNNPEFTMVCSNALNQRNEQLMEGESRILTSIDFLTKNPVIHPTVMLRRANFSTGNYTYNEKWKRAQDFELWSRVSRNKMIYYNDKPTIKYSKTFNLKNFSKQYCFFQIAIFKNLIWHLTNSSINYPKMTLVKNLLKFFFLPFSYVKIVLWNIFNAR
jgi:glycosyltransferase involved in cell wall biosynthesis